MGMRTKREPIERLIEGRDPSESARPAPTSRAVPSFARSASVQQILALQRTAGNHAVARVLARAGVHTPLAVEEEPEPAGTEAPRPRLEVTPTWSVSILELGALGPRDRAGELGEGALLFVGDTVSIRAKFEGLSDGEREALEPTIVDAGAVGPARGGWETDDTFAWQVDLLTVGPQTLAFETAGGDFEVVLVAALDAAGLKERLDLAPTLLDEKFGAALTAIEQAQKAWTVARDRQATLLEEVGAREQLKEDLLLTVFLATLAGGAGGVLAGLLKSVDLKALGGEVKTLQNVMESGITDTAKDGLKGVIRALPKAGGLGGSMPELAGDSTAPPETATPPGKGERAAQLEDPANFLGKLLGQVGSEQTVLAREIKRLQAAAFNVWVTGSTELFTEDPLAGLEHDTVLDAFTNELNTNPMVYLDQLWGAWLANYAYQLVPLSSPHTPVWLSLESNITPKLHPVLESEAEACGTTLDAWLAKYASELKARLEEEQRKRTESGEFVEPPEGLPPERP